MCNVDEDSELGEGVGSPSPGAPLPGSPAQLPDKQRQKKEDSALHPCLEGLSLACSGDESRRDNRDHMG